MGGVRGVGVRVRVIPGGGVLHEYNDDSDVTP